MNHFDNMTLCGHQQYSRYDDLLCHPNKINPIICETTHYQLDDGSYNYLYLTPEKNQKCLYYRNDLTVLSSAFGSGTQTECLAGTYKAYGSDRCTHSHHGFIHNYGTAKDTEYDPTISNNVCVFGSFCFEFVDTVSKSHVTVSRHCPLGTIQTVNNQEL